MFRRRDSIIRDLLQILLHRKSLFLKHSSEIFSLEASNTEVHMIVFDTSSIPVTIIGCFTSKRKISLVTIKISYPCVDMFHLCPNLGTKLACVNMVFVGNSHDMVFCSSVGKFILDDKPVLSLPENHSFLSFEVTKWTTVSSYHFFISEDFLIFVASSYCAHR